MSDDSPRAFREQLISELLAEADRALVGHVRHLNAADLDRTLCLNRLRPITGAHTGEQRHASTPRPSDRSERYLTSAFDPAQERPLRERLDAGRRVIERGQQAF